MSAEPQYANFDLLIHREGQCFVARVTSSPKGEATAEFEPPLRGPEAEHLRLLGMRKRTVRSLDSRVDSVARDIGERLFRAAFREEVLDRYKESRAWAQQQRVRLRIRLRLDADSHQLPWEYLRDPTAGGRYLGLDRDTPLVRYIEMAHQAPRPRVEGALKVLAVISAPKDREDLDAENEWRNIQTALGPLMQRGAVSVTRLEPPTFKALAKALEGDEYHVFHFVGHGGWDDQTKEGVLVFTRDDGTQQWITSDQLGPILGAEDTLQLAFLNACEGAVSEGRDIFAGCAQRLVGYGTPAVVAMQAEITDEAAIDFSERFYESLAAARPVDAALIDGRKAIFAQPNPLEWGTPVLYMRAGDGRLFDLAHPVAPVPHGAASAGPRPAPVPAPVPAPAPAHVAAPAPPLIYIPPPPTRADFAAVMSPHATPLGHAPAPAPAPAMAQWRKVLAWGGGTLLLLVVLAQTTGEPQDQLASATVPPVTFAPTAAATPAATVTTTSGQLAPTLVAAAVVDDFFAKLGKHEHYDAWLLLSERWKAEQPYGAFADGFENTLRTSFRRAQVEQVEPALVRVDGTIVATERVAFSVEEVVYRGSYHVRLIAGRWRIDAGSFVETSRKRV